MRFAYLSPEVLEHLVVRRVPPALSLNDLVAVADWPWAEQLERAFFPMTFSASRRAHA